MSQFAVSEIRTFLKESEFPFPKNYCIYVNPSKTGATMKILCDTYDQYSILQDSISNRFQNIRMKLIDDERSIGGHSPEQIYYIMLYDLLFDTRRKKDVNS